jgi:acetyl esterase/lipase
MGRFSWHPMELEGAIITHTIPFYYLSAEPEIFHMRSMCKPWRVISVLSLAACAATGIVGCKSTEPRPPSAVSAELDPSIDPMQFVDPELRGPLANFNKAVPPGGLDRLTVDMLPMARASAERRAQPLLPEPIPQQRVVPGIQGSPDVHIYLLGLKPGEVRPAILYIHGGGFILGSAKGSLVNAQTIALKHNCIVVSVEYRLAPDVPFPGSLNDNYAALKWLYEHAHELGVDRARIAVMGESSGGGHAAMLAIAARDRGEIPIKLQILVYPMLDDRTGSASDAKPWMGRFVWTAKINRLGWSSLLGVPAGSASVPEGAVPARESNLKGLPATFIAVGSIDLFANEDIQYAQRLMNEGIATELYVAPGAFHGFDGMAPNSAIAMRFAAAIDDAINRAFAEVK